MKAIAILVLGLAFLTGPALRAQEPLVRQEQKQEGIRDATARASEQLAQLVDEFDRNGIEGQDVDILKSIQSVLGRLSTDQMQKIVDLLQGARAGEKANGGQGQIIGAFTNQKAVIVQLRQVLLEYQRQLALHQIARLLRELGDRQSGNLHEGLALIATGRDKSAFRDSDKLSVQMQEAEQTSVRDEASGILGRLASLAGTTAEGIDNKAAEGTKFATGRKLGESLATAATDLNQMNLMSAATNEKAARDTLWELAAMLEAEKSNVEKLVEAVAELDELIDGEKDVIKATEQLDKDPKIAGEQALEQDRAVRKAREEFAKTTERNEKTKERESTNFAKAKERLQKEVESAKERLEKSRSEEKKDDNQIRSREEQVAKAEQDLERRSGEMDRRSGEIERQGAEQLAKREESVEKALEEARQRQDVSTPEEARERLVLDAQKEQAELVDKADFLQRQLESLSAPTSALLGESITDMQEAREELGRNVPPQDKIQPALAEEKAALSNLEAAREALLEQLDDANLVEAVPDTKKEALEELLDKVRDLKHAEEALMETAEKAEAENNTDALGAQAAPQGQLENETRQAQQAAAELAPEAASDLAEAAEMMDASTESLETGENAPDAQQAAVDALAMAEQRIEDQIGELEAAQAELAELNDLMEKLNPIIEKQQDLQSDANRESAQPEPNAQANQELAEQQGALQEETSALAQEVADSTVPQAAENLSDAAQDESAAKEDLAQNNPDAAQPDQSLALEDLNAAKGALEERMQELAEQLGESPQPAADFAAAQAAIAMAQEQVAEAMSQLDSPASLAEQLADRQEALADNIAEQAQAQAQAQGQPQSAESSPLAQAEAAAEQAAAQLAQGNMQEAVGQMQKAQEALGQAQEQAQAQGQPLSPAGEAAPAIPELAQEQAALQSLAEQLANANTAAATEPLASASDAISPFSSESQGALPPSAQAALEAAQSALAQAGAEAAANSPQPAQANAEAAQNALADAAAALALAEAGLSAPAMASAQTPSQGQGQTPGTAQGQTPAPGQQPSQAPPSPAPSNGNMGNQSPASESTGPRQAATGTSGFIGLPKRERGTIRQSSSESYPAEYGAQIEQYLKNLADQASGNK